MKGFEGALAAKADEVVVFGAATEAFSQKNINCSIAESRSSASRRSSRRRATHGMRVRGTISCVLGCPYEGEVDARRGRATSPRLMHDIGVHDVSLGDTIGVGTAGSDAAR